MNGKLAFAALLAFSVPSARAADAAPWTLQAAIGQPSNFTLSGSFRSRQESLSGQFRPNRGDSDQGLALRTSIAAEYRAPWLRLTAEVLDARVYGVDRDSTVSTSEVNTLELVQANVGASFGSLLGAGSGLAFKAGRYTLDLGSRRLVARNDFRNTTNVFTGVQLDWQSAAKTHAKLFWSLPVRRLVDEPEALRANRLRTDEEDLSLMFWGGHLEVPVPGAARLSVYGLVLDEDDAAGRATDHEHEQADRTGNGGKGGKQRGRPHPGEQRALAVVGAIGHDHGAVQVEVDAVEAGIDEPCRRVDHQPETTERRLALHSADEIIGRNCRFLRGAGTEPELTEELRAGIAARVPVMVELLNYKRDGTPFRNAVADLYMTNPIARSSAIMAECSALKNVRNLEAAE